MTALEPEDVAAALVGYYHWLKAGTTVVDGRYVTACGLRQDVADDDVNQPTCPACSKALRG